MELENRSLLTNEKCSFIYKRQQDNLHILYWYKSQLNYEKHLNVRFSDEYQITKLKCERTLNDNTGKL